MEITKINKKTGEAKIKISSNGDLSALNNIIHAGDTLVGKTERKIKLGGVDGRQKSVRKTITLEIKVTKLVLEDTALRVQGTVTKPTEDISMNSAHTIELSEGSDFKLKKIKWFNYQIDQLKQAEKKSKSPTIFLCVLDDEQANFGYLSASGLITAGKIKLRLTKKRFEEKKKDEIKRIAKEIIDKSKGLKVILGSPLFWKDYVSKAIKELDPKASKQVLLANVSTGSKKGLAELISTGKIDQLISGASFAEHDILISKLLSEIGKGKLAAYGLKEVTEATYSKAVKDLLVSEKLAKNEEVQTLIDTVEKSKGEVHIFGKKSDAGKKLDGLSGIAAILKFKI
jgi:protein pelota